MFESIAEQYTRFQRDIAGAIAIPPEALRPANPPRATVTVSDMHPDHMIDSMKYAFTGLIHAVLMRSIEEARKDLIARRLAPFIMRIYRNKSHIRRPRRFCARGV